MSSTARPFPAAAQPRPSRRAASFLFHKFSYADKVFYTQDDCVLRSSYKISRTRSDTCKYTLKETDNLNGNKSKMEGVFRELKCDRVEGQYELKEKSVKGKYSLKVKYKTDERQVVWGRYLYVEKYVEGSRKLILGGSYIAVGWTNEPIHHVITQDVRRIRIHGRSYVSSLRPSSTYTASPTAPLDQLHDNVRYFGSDQSLYRRPLEYNIRMHHRHNLIGSLDNIVCEGRRLAHSIARTIHRRGSTGTTKDPMSCLTGRDPSQGLVGRATERLQRASRLQNSVRMMILSSPEQRRRQHIHLMSERPSMTRSSPNLASCGPPELSPTGPPPSYDSIFNPNVPMRASVREQVEYF